ncbi:hypothetical protein [Cohnella soli]|uniref:Neutral/alkaline non-lysosomal ceramidase N-terminal domain-containing protein n=1 Tax=Cohnella soli TaxID=425005 RepID=A0ABW0HWX2_9BACL
MGDMLKASFGKVKITPEEMVPLQGYDPELYVADPETDILDDLYARIAVLDDGRRRSVIVSIDACLTNEQFVAVRDGSGRRLIYKGFSNTFPAGTRRSWAEAAKTAESYVTVHATHTHSAPVHFGEKYTSRIYDKIQELSQALVPVKMTVGTGTCSLAVCRRPNLTANDKIPIDKTLHVVVFESMQGEPLASIVNCAVHPTVLWNKANRVSSEFVGLAMGELEAAHGGGFVSLFLQGFTGDVGPLECGPSMGTTEDTYPLVKQYAQQLYLDATAAMHNRAEMSSVPLNTLQKNVPLPAADEYHRTDVDVTLLGVRIGDLALLAVTGEIFNGYVGPIRQSSPFQTTLFSCVANGYTGYLPTYEAFHDGLSGYEMFTTPFSDQACGLFASACNDLLKALKE